MKVSFVTIPTTIEPLGIMYLSASLKQAGHECSIGIDGDILAASEGTGIITEVFLYSSN